MTPKRTLRKAIIRANRIKVWEKFDKHCAYCGKPIEYKDMQIDHVIPVSWMDNDNCPQEIIDKICSIDNYFPACRSCNKYKNFWTVEGFRTNIETLYLRLKLQQPLLGLLERYGLLKYIPDYEPISIEFYFETIEKELK